MEENTSPKEERKEDEENSSTFNYTSSDNKIHVKISASSICTSIISFIIGGLMGFATANKYTLTPKNTPSQPK